MGYGYERTPFQIIVGLISPGILQLGINSVHRRSRRPVTKVQRIAPPPSPEPAPLPPPPPPNFTLSIVSTLGSSVPCQPTIVATDLKILPGSNHLGPTFPLLLAVVAVFLCVASSVVRWRKARGAQDAPATPPLGSYRPPRSPSFTPPSRQGSPIRYPPTPHPYPVQRQRGGRDDDEDEDDQETFVNEDPFGGDDHQEDVSDEEEKNISNLTAGFEEPPPPPPPPPSTAEGLDPNPFHHLSIWWFLLFLLAVTGLVLLTLAQLFPEVKNRLWRALRAILALDVDGAKARALLKHSARTIRHEFVSGGGREGTSVQRAATADDEAMSMVVGFVAVVGLVLVGGVVARGGRVRAVQVPQKIQAAQSAMATSEHHDGIVPRSGHMLSNASAQPMFREETTVANAHPITSAKISPLRPRKKAHPEYGTHVLPPNPIPASTHSQCSSKSMAVQAVAVPVSSQTLICIGSQATLTSALSLVPASTQTQVSTESQATQTSITTGSCATQTPRLTSAQASTQTEDVASMFAATQTLSSGSKTSASTSTQTQNVSPKYSSLSIQTDAELPPLVKVYPNTSVQSSPLLPSCTVVDCAAQTPVPTTACTNTIATQTDPVVDLQTDAPETTAAAIEPSSCPEKESSHSSNPTVFGMTTQQEIAFDFGALWGAGCAGDSRSDTTLEPEIRNESVWDPMFESSAFREVSVLSDMGELESSCQESSVVRESRWLETIEESIVEACHGLVLPVEVLVDIREEVLPNMVDLGILNSSVRELTGADVLEPAEMSMVQALEVHADPESTTDSLEDLVVKERDMSEPAQPLELQPEPSVLVNAESVSHHSETSKPEVRTPIVNNVRSPLHASRPSPRECDQFLAPFRLPVDYELSTRRKIVEPSEVSDFYNSDSDLDEAALAYCHPSYQDRVRKKQRARGALQARETTKKVKRVAELERRHQEMQAEKYARDEQARLQREDKEERARLALENKRLEEDIKSLREDAARRQTQADDEERVKVFQEAQKVKDAQEEQEIVRLEAELLRMDDDDRVWQSFEDFQMEAALRVQEMENTLARALEQLQNEQQRAQEEEVRARAAVFQAEEAKECAMKENRRFKEVSKAYRWTTTRLKRQVEENRLLKKCMQDFRRVEAQRVREIQSTLTRVHAQLHEEEQRRIQVTKDAQASATFLHKENAKTRAYHERQLQEEHDKQRQEVMRLEEEKKQLEEKVEKLQKEDARKVQEIESKTAQTHEQLREEEKIRAQEEKEVWARIANLQEMHETNLKERDAQEQRRLEEEREDRRRQAAQLLLQKEENKRLQDYTHQQEQQLQRGQEERSRWDGATLLLDNENKKLKEELACLKEQAARWGQESTVKPDCFGEEKQQSQEDCVRRREKKAKETYQSLAHTAEKRQVESLEVEEREGPLRQTGHENTQNPPYQEQKQPPGSSRLRQTPSTAQVTLHPSKGVFLVPKLRCVKDSPNIPQKPSSDEKVDLGEVRKNLDRVRDSKDPSRFSGPSVVSEFGRRTQENPNVAADLKKAWAQKKGGIGALVPAPSPLPALSYAVSLTLSPVAEPLPSPSLPPSSVSPSTFHSPPLPLHNEP